MAKRLRDVCALPESEQHWRTGRGFVVRDLPECARSRAQQRGQATGETKPRQNAFHFAEVF
jgi:hypothetical protein